MDCSCTAVLSRCPKTKSPNASLATLLLRNVSIASCRFDGTSARAWPRRRCPRTCPAARPRSRCPTARSRSSQRTRGRVRVGARDAVLHAEAGVLADRAEPARAVVAAPHDRGRGPRRELVPLVRIHERRVYVRHLARRGHEARPGTSGTCRTGGVPPSRSTSATSCPWRSTRSSAGGTTTRLPPSTTSP